MSICCSLNNLGWVRLNLGLQVWDVGRWRGRDFNAEAAEARRAAEKGQNTGGGRSKRGARFVVSWLGKNKEARKRSENVRCPGLYFAALNVVRGDAFGNMRRAEAFNRLRSLVELRQPADPVEWRIDPQTVGAVIMFSPNSEFFAAGILQPPYFDANGDDASNYGSAGVGLAHEISHTFDELGNIYDDHGRLANWWSADDLASYHALAAKMAAQVDGYCPLSDLCVNGKQVLSESIADLAGLRVAHDAYMLSLGGKTDVVIGGLTGELRFFVAFAQRWRRLQSEASLRAQIKTDTHSPGEYRIDTVRNVEAWYNAFQVVPGDKLYLRPEDRVGIW
jgi:putative endopeptidase